jgi:DNA gyrase subunit A
MAENEQKIVKRHIEDEMRQSYLDYSMSVIVGRALPDVRDGLKPVHRRVLFGMQQMGVFHNKPFKKSARIVGDVMGKFHPHGDAAVYDTLVRMAQDFSLRYPLVQGQGNFGSVDGDNAAAMRYTEARLAKIAEELLADLEKETIEYAPNFDNTLKEPVVLPSKLPNLLINGSAGIAVGMATNIPPHNLNEVSDAIIAQIKNPDITIPELLQHIKGPDFPTGGIIVGQNGMKEAYNTGRGLVLVRAKTELEQKGNNTSIIVREIPYMLNKSQLIEQMAEAIKEKTVEDVSDLSDRA